MKSIFAICFFIYGSCGTATEIDRPDTVFLKDQRIKIDLQKIRNVHISPEIFPHVSISSSKLCTRLVVSNAAQINQNEVWVESHYGTTEELNSMKQRVCSLWDIPIPLQIGPDVSRVIERRSGSNLYAIIRVIEDNPANGKLLLMFRFTVNGKPSDDDFNSVLMSAITLNYDL